MVVVGSGAIGSEFAYFYNAMGTKVTLIEFMPAIVQLKTRKCRSNWKRVSKNREFPWIDSSVESVDTSGAQCVVKVKTKKGEQEITCDIVLSAVGIATNIENIGLGRNWSIPIKARWW